ncbi:MAG: biopolymer transporter ExbD [Prevotellaceae bacterium]|jgi:biopolymer transport protein ExbD|nr:biopolymer transporter ExbD [Prevotellaceae bacterium]
MADIETGGKQKGGKGKQKKMSTHVDLTPMVDLAFLLITFFMLTTTMIKPQTMELAMPSKEKTDKPNLVKESRAITIVLGKDNKVFYWTGKEENGVKPEVTEADFSGGEKGIRRFLIERNYEIMTQVRELDREQLEPQTRVPDTTYNRKKSEIQKQKTSPVVIIKVTDDANYEDLIDILDEMAICNIGTYAIVDITPEDLEMIKGAKTL